LSAAWVLFAALAATTLSGCSRSIDAAQTQIIQGLVYKLNDSDPFSGEVKNASVRAVSAEAEPGTCTLPCKDGHLHGTVTCQSENGKKILEQEWNQGRKEGAEKIWDSHTGNLRVEAHWKADKEDGVYEVYNPAINKLVMHNEYKSGKLEGEQKIWDVRTGETLLTDLTWKDGRKTGYSKSRDLEENYRDGKLHGARRHYTYTDQSVVHAMLEAERLVQQVRGGDYFGGQFPGAKIDVDETYVDGLRTAGAQRTSMSLSDCKDLYLWGHRKQLGPDAIVTADQLADWEALCKAGKYPPY
jgi:antitoxin component YwqK of YwqJK toxin-antitoxin module